MKRILPIILAISIVLLAQNNSQSPGRVEHQLRITDQMLAEISAEIEPDATALASQYSDQAQAVQRQAWDEFQSGNTGVAKHLTEQARTLLQKARGAMKRLPDENKKRVMRLLEQNRNLAEQVAVNISKSGRKDLQDMFESAIQISREAEKMLETENASTAEKLAKQAQSMLKKIATNRIHTPEEQKVNDALERTDELIEMVSDEIGDNRTDKTAALLIAAKELQRAAKDALDREDARQAAKLTLRARKKAQQVKGQTASIAVSIESVQRQIEKSKEAVQEIDDASNSKVSALVADARRMLKEAEKALENGDANTAKAISSSACALIAKTMERIDDTPSAKNVGKALDMTEKLIGETDTNTHAAKQYLQQAQELQRQARNAYENGELSDALSKTRVARELANRAARE